MLYSYLGRGHDKHQLKTRFYDSQLTQLCTGLLQVKLKNFTHNATRILIDDFKVWKKKPELHHSMTGINIHENQLK